MNKKHLENFSKALDLLDPEKPRPRILNDIIEEWLPAIIEALNSEKDYSLQDIHLALTKADDRFIYGHTAFYKALKRRGIAEAGNKKATE